MQLSSPAFAAHQVVPTRFTCDGEDVSPPLQWSGAPAGTRSFAVLCDDPDAPNGLWRHWAAFDIPADLTGLPEDADRHADALRIRLGVNDFHKPGYGGPCPPRDHGVHRYRFHLLALPVDRLDLGPRPSCGDVEQAARGRVLAESVLVGLYER